MHQLTPSPSLLTNAQGKTVLVTGSARGIGAATAQLFNSHGANVIIADLPSLREAAETLISSSLAHPERAMYVPANITNWAQLVSAFEQGIARFGRIDHVVANAAIMEGNIVLDMELDAEGKPMESTEGVKVLDVNLKGTLNTLRLGLHYIGRNKPDESSSSSSSSSRGSIVLVTSTSGYFGTTGNAAYIASKHGVVGLLRSSQEKAKKEGIRVNGIAPCFTPTHITAGFSGEGMARAGIESNTPEMVGEAIAYAALDPGREGTCCLVAGKYLRELEHTQKGFVNDWLGADLMGMLGQFGQYLQSIGGYKLPPKASTE